MTQTTPDSATVFKLLERANALKSELVGVEGQIDNYQRLCRHDWSEPKYEPTIHPAYSIPADHHGSDYSPAVHVPETTTKKWTRKCKNCWKIEETNRTKIVRMDIKNGLTSSIEAPDFGDR